MKKYQIIYADPPWMYQGKMMNSSVTDHYQWASLQDICKIPIREISDKDCILFMWVTMPKLNEFMEVVKAWGFEYKSCAFVWVKMNKKSTDTYFMGQGRWTRANPEICILATKGTPKRISAGVRQLVTSPIREHSQKPDEVKTRILQLVGDLPRIELFARQKTDGWDVWGNEVESDIDLIANVVETNRKEIKMKITFKVIKSESEYESRDQHIVLADGNKMMSQGEGMEPEDVVFHRDLTSPFECKKLIELVIEKVKAGEEVTFENVEEKEES